MGQTLILRENKITNTKVAYLPKYEIHRCSPIPLKKNPSLQRSEAKRRVSLSSAQTRDVRPCKKRRPPDLSDGVKKSSGKLPSPETNIALENGWLECYFPFGMVYFQGRTVSFREGNIAKIHQFIEHLPLGHCCYLDSLKVVGKRKTYYPKWW